MTGFWIAGATSKNRKVYWNKSDIVLKQSRAQYLAIHCLYGVDVSEKKEVEKDEILYNTDI